MRSTGTDRLTEFKPGENSASAEAQKSQFLRIRSENVTRSTGICPTKICVHERKMPNSKEVAKVLNL